MTQNDKSTCKTCQWWSSDPLTDGGNKHQCFHEKLCSFEMEAPDGAFTERLFFPGPDFGCIHHEPIAVKSALQHKA